MSQKFIFFDIDGTILSHRTFQMSDSTIAAIRQARKNGHLTFVNTGRTYVEIEDAIKNVGFNGFVCGCGTYIQNDSSVLFHTSIDRKTIKLLIEDIRNYKFDAVLEGTSAIYFDHHLQNDRIKFVQDLYQRNNLNVLTWDDPDIIFDKFCMWSDNKEAFEHFSKKYSDQFDFIDRGASFYECIPKGYSKATGIEYLLNHLHIPHENTFALGDSSNDLAMLRYVKNSIGMGNSMDQIKKLVSYVTKDVDEDGVSHALRHYHII